MDKTEEIQKLESKRNDLWNEIHSINNKITNLEIENMNYEGKYVKLPEYGYMFVTWQHLDTSHNIYSDDRMFLQGYSFDGEITDYTDMFDIYCTALRDIYIPLDTFKRFHNDGEIKILTKEEFKNELTTTLLNFIDNWEEMLDFCEENYNNKINNK